MVNKNKQIGINLIASIISFSVSLGISFFLVPFIVEKIGKEAYGFVGLASSFTQYASILTMALNSMAGRFITVSLSRGDKKDAAKYISSVFAANLILAMLLSVVGAVIIVWLGNIIEISEDLLPSVQILWAFIFCSFILSLITNVFSCASFSKNRLELNSAVSIINSAVKAIILVIAFSAFTPFVWYLGAANFVCTCISAIASFYIFKKLMPDIHIRKAYIELKKITILLASGIWNSISQISSILLEELDLLITNLYVSAGAMGTVAIAKNLPSKLLAFFVLFGNAFSPQITIDYAKGNREGVKRELISACRLVSFCSSVPLVILYVYGREFFSLWVPTEDSAKLYIIAVLACLEFPLVIPSEPMWKVFTAANKTRQTATVAIITAITSVSLTFGFLQLTNDEFERTCIIVGVSSCLGLLRGAFFLPLYGARCVGVKWYSFYPVLLKNLCCLTAGCIIAWILKRFIVIASWKTMIINCIIISIVVLCINFFVLLSKREREYLINKYFRRK